MAVQGSILGSLGQAAGIGSSNVTSRSQIDAFNQAIMGAQHNTGYAETIPAKPIYNFNFEEIENGWVIHFRGKKWMVTDLEELSQRVVAIMVENKLEK